MRPPPTPLLPPAPASPPLVRRDEGARSCWHRGCPAPTPTPAPIPRDSFAGDISGDGRFVVIESNGDIATNRTEARNNADGNQEIFLFDYAQRRVYQITDTKSALKDTVLLQADVTANDDKDHELLKHFGIFGPPTIAFYGADGEEKRNFRVVGFMKAAEFAAVVRQAVAPATHPAT